MIPEINDSVGGIFLYARICKKQDWNEYERLKRLVANLNLTHEEYVRVIQRVAELLKV